MSQFEEFLKSHIAQHGPVDIGSFMGMAMGHPEYGYYASRDPFGRGGDFITTPEMSQIFGELIGMWLADVWMKMGEPAKVYLLECGPGRGTLMADILRVAQQIPKFYESLQVGLYEISPVLREIQANSLKEHQITWFEGLDDLPDDAPVLLIGNELFDALPMRQYLKTPHGWGERVVAFDPDADSFVFGFREASADFLEFSKHKDDHMEIIEYAPARMSFWQAICQRVKAQGGVALFIDYGYHKTGPGDSLQAVKEHQFVDVLSDIGNADLSSHVDFGALADVAVEQDVRVTGIAEQRDFLQMLGILNRAHALKKNASEAQRTEIDTAVERMMGVGQFGMGKLFKVIACSADDKMELCGFKEQHYAG